MSYFFLELLIGGTETEVIPATITSHRIDEVEDVLELELEEFRT